MLFLYKNRNEQDMKTLVPYGYPDQVIADTWVDWSVRFLSESPNKKFDVATGFQGLAGAGNSNVRTRGGEFFELGLLRGRLIHSKGSVGDGAPPGFKLLLSDENVHTRLG